MKWEVLDISEFSHWHTDWQTLNKTLANLPILNATFIQSCIDVFANGNEKLAIGKENDAIVAMTILNQTSKLTWETFQPSQAPVGLWLCPTEKQEKALQSLIRKLPGFVLKLDILHQDPSIYPRPSGNKISIKDYIETGKITFDQEFDTYFANLGKNQRQNYNKAHNRLRKQDINVQLVIETEPEKMRECIAQYGELESKSWKNELGTAIHIDNEQGKFFHDIMQEFAKNDNAEVWKYYYDDNLVAVDLCVKNGDVIIILKTTFDSEYARYAPAICMKLDALKRFFSEKPVGRIEFFGKMLEWHKRVKSEPRTMYHYSYFRYAFIRLLKKA